VGPKNSQRHVRDLTRSYPHTDSSVVSGCHVFSLERCRHTSRASLLHIEGTATPLYAKWRVRGVVRRFEGRARDTQSRKSIAQRECDNLTKWSSSHMVRKDLADILVYPRKTFQRNKGLNSVSWVDDRGRLQLPFGSMGRQSST